MSSRRRSAIRSLKTTAEALSPDHFEIDGTVYSVQFLLQFAEGLWLGIDRELPVEFTLSAGESSYEGSESKVPVTGSGSGGYWWPSADFRMVCGRVGTG